MGSWIVIISMQSWIASSQTISLSAFNVEINIILDIRKAEREGLHVHGSAYSPTADNNV